MLTSSSAASVVTSASTPGRSGTGTRTSPRSPALATRAGRLARAVRARSRTVEQAGAVVGRPRCRAPGCSAADEAVERVDDGVAVLGADVGPDARVAGGDAGHVAEAAGGQPQQRRVLLGALVGQAHERRGGEVGHVGHHGHERVVAIGRQGDDVGAEVGDHRAHARRRRRRRWWPSG